jgi:hypothetical protein
VKRGYTDQIEPFEYRGHTLEAQVTRQKPSAAGALPEPGTGIWCVRIGKDRFAAFPASLSDTEDEIRQRVKEWFDVHFPG